MTRANRRSRLVTSLALGVASTFVLAYGAALLPGVPEWARSSSNPDRDRLWLAGSTMYSQWWPSEDISAGDARARQLMSAARNDLYDEPGERLPNIAAAPGIDLEGVIGDEMVVTAVGVPLRCLWSWENHAGMVSRRPDESGGELVRALWPRASPGAPKLAYLPLWWGLAVNVLVYTGLWWALCSLMAAIVRKRRRAHGICDQCRYDRRGLTPAAPCPECGTAPIAPR